MKRIVVVASFVLAILLPRAYSANVTVVAEGPLAHYDDPMGALPFAEPAPGTIFTLKLTYDSAIAPSNPDTTYQAIYSDAVLDFSLTIGNESFGLLDTKVLSVTNDIELLPDDFADAWGFYTYSITPTGNENEYLVDTIRLRMNTHRSEPPVPPLTSTDLIAPEWPSLWGFGDISYSVQLENDLGTSYSAFSSAQITSISVVPVPAAAWLMASAIGLLGWIGRKTR